MVSLFRFLTAGLLGGGAYWLCQQSDALCGSPVAVVLIVAAALVGFFLEEFVDFVATAITAIA